jgi:hypothetical protein
MTILCPLTFPPHDTDSCTRRYSVFGLRNFREKKVFSPLPPPREKRDLAPSGLQKHIFAVGKVVKRQFPLLLPPLDEKKFVHLPEEICPPSAEKNSTSKQILELCEFGEKQGLTTSASKRELSLPSFRANTPLHKEISEICKLGEKQVSASTRLKKVAPSKNEFPEFER